MEPLTSRDASGPAPIALSDQPLAVALAGMASLAAAMGIGRFAFTPLLPMMLHDGVVTLAGGSWLATANYLGYLVGALACMALPWLAPRARQVWHAARLARWGLVATVLLTLGMALPLPATWPALRFAAGVASALVFLNVSVWCMVRLVALGQPALGGLIFCGPGLGIVLTGLSASAMVALQWPAAAGWAVFGVLSMGLCAAIWPVLHGVAQPPAANGAAHLSGDGLPGHGPWARTGLTLAYGLAGLGYIVTATFLPVIARAALPAGSPWPDLFWPLFGAGVALGAALSTRTPAGWDRRWLLTAAYVVQAAAIALSLVWPGPAGFALGSLLLGLPFTAITFYALQEARRVWPSAGDSFPGLLTAAYGIGQIAGPPMVAWMLHHTATQGEGFVYGLAVAAAALAVGAGLYAAMAWRWPLQKQPAR
ncbi:MAG: YbfB/YjiJ family MFS transporter [Gammaproteobacteria bacterium]|nr:YbfB/YjiJ family MFS transporter [Gammaproteobacteria bacterium]MBU1507898.1 YbfB/YjiJ family MFS transporter [Gammaproteobacteria bacterium]MBU2121396.1 YbfB/YjiJ family MFS transporter [Gammaproteobacteria bacterium]MBU2172257.1 YbfB/YjiJ family MFS transporter [Gammaproteobacteria bacterium]MBU2200283.1 YbfB/YjiJ family MFS transporter [Gammaproteobacteria bacterium]